MLHLKIPLLIAIVLFLLGCGSQSSTTVTSSSNSDLNLTSTILHHTKQEILLAINNARNQARDCHDGSGVVGPASPLTWNVNLYDAAYEHSYDLAYSNTFSHFGSGTEFDITGFNNDETESLFYERIEANGYTDYISLGENIAGGQYSFDEVLNAWLDSPEHCINLMNNSFTEVGVAVVVKDDSEYGIYWTQNFGSR
ncbi:MAG: CAP domain-containing protein [Epsilonproteobacteria bacterium]|nr:CAP domain-containing protein [Campylobacterota bacterium]